jgi:hypothetical protein
VIGPQDVGLSVEQVGFQRLGLVVAVVEDGVEGQFTQTQDAYFVAGFFGAGDVGVGEGRAEAGAGRVAEDDQDALAHGGAVLKTGVSGWGVTLGGESRSGSDWEWPGRLIPFLCRTFPREFQALAPAKSRD